ncbi:unnamed protein product [Amoebophrya sp. A25]|nr:unnamed protein product [Amoebophrya sp. A25]|eukprot:GSA25T00002206001.1
MTATTMWAQPSKLRVPEVWSRFRSSTWSTLFVLFWSILHRNVHGAGTEIELSEYLVVSQPRDRSISYLHLSKAAAGVGTEDGTSNYELKPLVRTGLVTPTSVAIDPSSKRLFVVDQGKAQVLYYILSELDEGTLITDGHQHVCVDQIEVDGMTVSPEGDLFLSAKLLLPATEPAMQHFSIFKHPRAKIDAGAKFDPVLLWDRAFSANLAWQPGPLAIDSRDLYWGDRVVEPASLAAVVRAPRAPAHLAPPAPTEVDESNLPSGPTSGNDATYGFFADPGEKVTAKDFLSATGQSLGPDAPAPKSAPVVSAVELSSTVHTTPLPLVGVSEAMFQVANGTSGVRAVCVSSKSVFYSMGSKVYAASKARQLPNCVLTSDCTPITSEAVEPAGLVWDGDGSVYVADPQKTTDDGTGGVFRIPAGSEVPHAMELIHYVPNIQGLTYMKFEIEKKGAVATFLESFWGA